MTVSRRTGLLAAVGSLGAVAAGCAAPSAPGPSAPSDASPAAPSPAGASAGAPSTATTAPTASATAQPSTPPAPWAGVADPLPSGPVNVLIVGTDNTTNVGNTDVLVVAQLSADRTRVGLVGIPRDSWVSIASGGKDKINSALYRGGISNTKRTVSNLLDGLEIHYVAQANFATFIKLCVLFNGFGVTNKISSSVTSKVTGKVTRFPAGKMVKYGADWLIYARQRHGLPRGEFDRGERHRAIVTGMTTLLKYLSFHQPQRLASIAPRVFDYVNVYGGLDRDNVLGLIPTLQRISWTGFTSVKLPVAAVNDAVTLDFGRLAELSAALHNGDIAPYVARYGSA